jgi:hypothetical protein
METEEVRREAESGKPFLLPVVSMNHDMVKDIALIRHRKFEAIMKIDKEPEQLCQNMQYLLDAHKAFHDFSQGRGVFSFPNNIDLEAQFRIATNKHSPILHGFESLCRNSEFFVRCPQNRIERKIANIIATCATLCFFESTKEVEAFMASCGISKNDAPDIHEVSQSFILANHKDSRVFLNIDPDILESEKLCQVFFHLVSEIPEHAKSRLVFEVTERSDNQSILKMVSLLRERGFLVALDDACSDIHPMPIKMIKDISGSLDYIKIDALNLLSDNPRSRECVEIALSENKMIVVEKTENFLRLYELLNAINKNLRCSKEQLERFVFQGYAFMTF